MVWEAYNHNSVAYHNPMAEEDPDHVGRNHVEPHDEAALGVGCSQRDQLHVGQILVGREIQREEAATTIQFSPWVLAETHFR